MSYSADYARRWLEAEVEQLRVELAAARADEARRIADWIEDRCARVYPDIVRYAHRAIAADVRARADEDTEGT